MPVRTLCDHLRILSEKLEPVSAPDSYRVGRIWQNLRLDLPGIHDNFSGSFTDGRCYPNDYPDNRGANVSTEREGRFVGRILGELPNLKQIADRALNGDQKATLVATADYFKKIEHLWGDDGNLTTDDRCNGNNCANIAHLPNQLTRYIDFRSFVAYTLLPNADPARWQPHEVQDFIDQLILEKASPGKHWQELANIWVDVRQRIRSGSLTFSLPPRYHRGDVKFVGDGENPVHHSSSHPPGSLECLHHVIQALALPGWEMPAHREKKLGMVAILIPNSGFKAYRPTILDTLGAYSYFFLPGQTSARRGTTWMLTPNLQYNSQTDHSGMSEWTAIVQKPGILCVSQKSGIPEPAFNLVGLEFGLQHAALFEL